MSDDCLFCKIIAGEIPSNKVYSDDDVYAFHDINAAAPQHILIVPKKHLGDITHAGAEDQALLGTLLLRANKIAEDQVSATSSIPAKTAGRLYPTSICIFSVAAGCNGRRASPLLLLRAFF